MLGLCGWFFMNKYLKNNSYFLKVLIFFIIGIFLTACQDKSMTKLEKGDDQVVDNTQKSEKYFPKREALIESLKNEVFDVLIIGGGANGAGALLEAQSRGLKSALIEKLDFASGTSGKSTKLVHGGIRYLENAIKHLDYGEFKLVTEALKERKIILQNAPHLAQKIALITPVYSWWEAIYYWVGLKIYDLISKESSLGPSEFISFDETLKRFPLLKKEKLKGSIVYYDGQFNDARMGISLILTAIKEGAVAVNYLEAQSFLKENNNIYGLKAQDNLTNEIVTIRSKVVINATGPFVDDIRKMDDAKSQPIIVLSKGSHVVLGEEFSRKDLGMVIPKTKDGRVLFVLPWLNKTIVGTTDVTQELTEQPKASLDEVDFILQHLSLYYNKKLTHSDILATFSGLRALVRPSFDVAQKTRDISREYLIETSPSGLLTIAGGKWTTYRKMAEDLIDKAILLKNLKPIKESQTAHLRLLGGKFYKDSLKKELKDFEHLAEDIAQNLVRTYGDRVDEVINIDNKTKLSRLVDDYPFIEAEVIYGIRYEYVQTPSDVLARRMRLAFLDHHAAILALPKVSDLMAKELLWSEEKKLSEEKKALDYFDTLSNFKY